MDRSICHTMAKIWYTKVKIADEDILDRLLLWSKCLCPRST